MNSNHNNNEIPCDDSATQHTLLREIEFSFDQLKQRVMKKFDTLKEISLKQAIEGSKKVVKRAETLNVHTTALSDFEKTVSREMEGLKFGLMSERRAFSPSVVETIEVPSNIGFNYGANVYNQKHNMIITCPSNSYVYFYDASTLNPMKNRKRQQINSSVVQMSYDTETDTHLMGCAFGDIYAYDATKNTLKNVLREGESFILAISHLGKGNFAFSSSKTGKIFFGNINSPTTISQNSYNSDAWYLHNIREKNLLLSGLSNGKIAIYDTKKPNFPLISSIQAHRFGKYVTAITNVNIKGKDYIITGGNDKTIKIWHTVKGNMRLLKVIPNEEDVSTIVYLEEYQMIATTHHRDFIKFFKIPSGTLQAKVELGLNKARNIFLMKDKNSLGVADLTRNYIKVVQLHPSESTVKNI